MDDVVDAPVEGSLTPRKGGFLVIPRFLYSKRSVKKGGEG